MWKVKEQCKLWLAEIVAGKRDQTGSERTCTCRREDLHSTHPLCLLHVLVPRQTEVPVPGEEEITVRAQTHRGEQQVGYISVPVSHDIDRKISVWIWIRAREEHIAIEKIPSKSCIGGVESSGSTEVDVPRQEKTKKQQRSLRLVRFEVFYCVSLQSVTTCKDDTHSPGLVHRGMLHIHQTQVTSRRRHTRTLMHSRTQSG